MEAGMRNIGDKHVANHEHAVKDLHDDLAIMLKVKAASDELTSSLDAQEEEHKAAAVKRQMEDKAYFKKRDEYMEKGLQDDVAIMMKVKAASDELSSSLDAQIEDQRVEAVTQKMEDKAFYGKRNQNMESSLQKDIAMKLQERVASEELSCSLDAQIEDHRAEAVKRQMEDKAYGEMRDENMERRHQDDIAMKVQERAASDELSSSLDAQIEDHRAEAVKRQMEDKAYGEMRDQNTESSLQNDIAMRLQERSASNELSRSLDAQIEDHRVEAVKRQMEDKAYGERRDENTERRHMGDVATKLQERAASDELSCSLDAQIEDHRVEAVKRQMEDKAYGEMRDEYMERGHQDDIAMTLKVRAASAELNKSLDAQVVDHKVQAVKEKMRDKVFYVQMMEGLEAADLREEEAHIVAKTKQQVYAADLLQQIEDNKKRRERERKLNM